MHIAFQALNNPVALAQAVSLAQTEAKNVVCTIVTTPWLFFLSQFFEFELLLFYLQAREFNNELSLELLLTNTSLYSLGILVTLKFCPSNLKQKFFSSIRLKKPC
jgi:hypothetical protein